MEYELLRKARIFEQLSDQEVEEALYCLKPHRIRLDRDDLFIRDGQEVSFFGIVEEGEMAATKLYKDGSQSLMLKFLPSYIVGVDIAATKRKISTYYVTAVKQSCVSVIDYSKVARPGQLDERIRLLMMESILALIAGENIRKMSKIEIISRKGLRDKILTFLAIQRSFYKSNEFDIDFNREELAEYLCVNRSALSHELRRMEQEHLIYCRKNHFRILDAEIYDRELLR